MEEEEIIDTPLVQQIANLSLDVPVTQQIRINQIRHRFSGTLK